MEEFPLQSTKGDKKFALKASIDTLPTKANLCLWGKRTNNKCKCGAKKNQNHILNCCHLALNEGRFTFRHDGGLNYIASCLDTLCCYVDIPGHQTPAGGTLPPDVIVSTLKQDIVIVDRKNRRMSIFELTCPAEHQIETAHTLKEQKYSHFEKDIAQHMVTVAPFEVGSHTGFV
jgi:hypothetical protein